MFTKDELKALIKGYMELGYNVKRIKELMFIEHNYGMTELAVRKVVVAISEDNSEYAISLHIFYKDALFELYRKAKADGNLKESRELLKEIKDYTETVLPSSPLSIEVKSSLIDVAKL